MSKQNLKLIRQRAIELNLREVEIYKTQVVGNNKFCDKIHVPIGWKGKKVLVVMLE